MIKVLALVASLCVAGTSFADLPKNDLWREDNPSITLNVNQSDFAAALNELRQIYAPIVARLGGKLELNGDWQDSTVNAYAMREGNIFRVQMFGGLARRPEVTLDGFKMVICHELGHHLGGYPAQSWASFEGQSDYYATHVCAKKVFKNHLNAVKDINPWCKWWRGDDDKKVCTLTLAASESLANMLATLNGEPLPKFWTPDPSVVRQTDPSHPKAQCRLDTMLSGAQCGMPWNDSIIPRTNSAVCDNRPKCWYAQ